MKTSLTTIYLIFILLFSGFATTKPLSIYELKCENLPNPLGIDKTIPRFSWKIGSVKNGTEQRAYQVLVASSPELLKKDQADLWNSTKIESSSSILVPYQGKPLGSGLFYFWKVRIWDESGNVSPWSSVGQFSVGLLNKEDWKASYIAFPTEAGYTECPQLKQSFNLNKTGDRMLLHVNSLGYHEVYLNGKKVGDGVLTPAVSQFDKRSWVVTYDVSDLVKKGQNQVILWLGSGWYTQGLPGVANNGPVVKAQLEKIANNKRETILATDASWLGRKSSYTRHGNWLNHRFGGEIIDGSLSQTDLSPENNQNRIWRPVSLVSIPDYAVSPQVVEQNKIAETIKPVEIKQIGVDTFLVDMGKSSTGWTEIHFQKLQKSQEVVLEYSDHLDKRGKIFNLKQLDRYIACGEEPEVFKNKFNYHGYRYIRISNLKKAPSAEAITGYFIHTGFEKASGFECSDPDMNKIHDLVNYTLRCLSIGGDLVDCPTVERLGYGGDGNASTATVQTMFNVDPLYANWLQAWADCIREDGGMPHTAPCPYSAGGGPYWCGFIITASWKAYQNYGDVSILEKYYPVMQKWLDYVKKYSPDGLLKPWPEADYRSWFLGDWATPKGIDQKAESSIGVVTNCFIAYCYDNMQKIAQVLGKTEDSRLYAQKKSDLQKLIHQKYFDPAKNSYSTGTQIDLTYPMLTGVVPTELKDAVKQSLITETKNRDGHLSTGLVGIPVLTEWCVKNHEVNLMYEMLKKRDYPSYLYMIDNGATSTWEHWNGERSHIHNCYNGIGTWFYQAIGGIRTNEDVPAYQKVIIDPQVPKGLTWAKTYKETPYGKLAVNWELNGKTMKLDVEIPVGIDADVVIPSGVKKYNLDGKEFNLSGDQSTVKLKSGKYTIVYTI